MAMWNAMDAKREAAQKTWKISQIETESPDDLSLSLSICRYTNRPGSKLNMIYLLDASICGLATATHTRLLCD